jgi:hypothetical protein
MARLSLGWRYAVLAVLIGVAAGCSRSKPNLEVTEEKTHILRALKCWQEYRKANSKPPKSMEELKAWAQKHVKPGALEQWGSKNVEELFTSPRDGQLYVVHPPQSTSPGMLPGRAGVAQVVLSERVGVNGKALSVTGMGNISEQEASP